VTPMACVEQPHSLLHARGGGSGTLAPSRMRVEGGWRWAVLKVDGVASSVGRRKLGCRAAAADVLEPRRPWGLGDGRRKEGELSSRVGLARYGLSSEGLSSLVSENNRNLLFLERPSNNDAAFLLPSTSAPAH
jgi:hypothetical protein